MNYQIVVPNSGFFVDDVSHDVQNILYVFKCVVSICGLNSWLDYRLSCDACVTASITSSWGCPSSPHNQFSFLFKCHLNHRIIVQVPNCKEAGKI